MLSDYERVWTEVGILIALGEKTLTRGHLDAILCNLKISEMNPNYLPGKNTVEGTEQERKTAIFNLA